MWSLISVIKVQKIKSPAFSTNFSIALPLLNTCIIFQCIWFSRIKSVCKEALRANKLNEKLVTVVRLLVMEVTSVWGMGMAGAEGKFTPWYLTNLPALRVVVSASRDNGVFQSLFVCVLASAEVKTVPAADNSNGVFLIWKPIHQRS